MILGVLSPWVASWLTPIWLLGVGALLGLVGLAALWLVVALISLVPPFRTWNTAVRREARWADMLTRPLAILSRRAVVEIPAAVREGVLWPLLIITLSLAAFGVVGVVFVDEPLELLRSLADLPSSDAAKHPEVATVPLMAVSIVALFVLYLLHRAAAPRLSAIALATYKSEIAQPLFAIIVGLGLFLLWLFIWIPYNTFGEDIKMLKDSGMALIMVLGIIQALWAASTSIAEEIEGRTALTVLSKPIGRRSFIIGKFLGIVWTIALLFIVLGLMFLICIAYKPIYDARESVTGDVTWQVCHMEMSYTVPGLVLAFLETVVLAAVSVAISTRLPMLANFVICGTIYVLGHLTPLIVESSIGTFAPVQFFGQLIATIVPVLDHFNVQAAVASGIAVPPVYLFWSLVYCLIYSLIALLLALLLFEDRDLA